MTSRLSLVVVALLLCLSVCESVFLFQCFYDYNQNPYKTQCSQGSVPCYPLQRPCLVEFVNDQVGASISIAFQQWWHDQYHYDPMTLRLNFTNSNYQTAECTISRFYSNTFDYKCSHMDGSYLNVTIVRDNCA